MLIHHLSLCESESFVPVGFLSLIESDQPDFFESLIEPESRCFFAESESHDDSESEPCDGLKRMCLPELAEHWAMNPGDPSSSVDNGISFAISARVYQICMQFDQQAREE
jgi:hypothetical protein